MSRPAKALVAGCLAAALVVPPEALAADRNAEGLVRDPRKAELPPTHRFRLGIQMMYMRLTQATDEMGGSKRFHFLPLEIDLAYQAQFARVLMVRPSFAFGPNVHNSWTAMPFIIHPQLHFGYQGRLVGAAVGYGFFTPVYSRKDAEDPIRGGLGQPVFKNNHYVGGELSFTTRIDRSALTLALRVGAVNSLVQHFDVNARQWRPAFMLNVGWFFGRGKKRKRRKPL